MKLSIVTTLYRSSSHLNEFYERMTKTANGITPDYELVMVNDGSPDDSLDKAIAIHLKDPKTKVIDLARNFGHHKALMAGIAYGKGDYVFMIDCDLEEAPELLATYWNELAKDPIYDVVYGICQNERGNWFELLGRRIFFKSFNWLSDIEIPRNVASSRLCTRRYCEALLQYCESEVFLAGLWFSVGFRQKPISIVKDDSSQTTYTLRKKIAMFVNALVSFSSLPLVYVFGLGIALSGFSGILILLMVIGRLFFGVGVSMVGWASTIISIWFVGGIIIFCLGVLGLYISKMFIEVKKRPATIVRSYYDNERSRTA